MEFSGTTTVPTACQSRLSLQCRDWPYSVPARGEEADGGHCGRDGQIESRRTRDIDACRCGQVGQDHQTTWHHSGMTEIPEFAALLEEIVGSQHHRSFSVDWPFEELTRCSLLNRIAQPQKLIYSLICLHLMLAFKIVHRRGANRTPHCLAVIKHREINDHPIEVVAQYFASLQRHCKSSVLKRSDYAISAGLARCAHGHRVVNAQCGELCAAAIEKWIVAERAFGPRSRKRYRSLVRCYAEHDVGLPERALRPSLRKDDDLSSSAESQA